jgi:hypothetical protein
MAADQKSVSEHNEVTVQRTSTWWPSRWPVCSRCGFLKEKSKDSKQEINTTIASYEKRMREETKPVLSAQEQAIESGKKVIGGNVPERSLRKVNAIPRIVTKKMDKKRKQL